MSNSNSKAVKRMSDKGWIALHRNIRDHWVYQEKRVFSKYEAWLDLLMDANHQDNKFVFDGKLVEVERGQKVTSIRQLSERWGWSRTKVTDFLTLLEKDKMLVRKSDSKKTVLTIVNYDIYQNQEQEKSHSNDTEKPQKSTNNNVKTMSNNENNKTSSSTRKKRVYDPDSIYFILAEKLSKQICQNQEIKEPNLNRWADDIRKMIEIDKRTESQVSNMIDWATSDPFWSAVILSAKKLRDKYDTMAAQANRDYKTQTSVNNSRSSKKQATNYGKTLYTYYEQELRFSPNMAFDEYVRKKRLNERDRQALEQYIHSLEE